MNRRQLLTAAGLTAVAPKAMAFAPIGPGPAPAATTTAAATSGYQPTADEQALLDWLEDDMNRQMAAALAAAVGYFRMDK